MHLSEPLVKAWAALIALSLGAALLTVLGLPARVTGAAIVLVALAKARVILARYLGLDAAPGVLRGFTMVLGLFAALVLGLYLV
ncbi:nitric oxide reductase F protein [Seohaeicola saemankumensis]|nr:cytochrome C oxidase subunit IV family protein [Seohaeicola saemankumensis]MCA0872492.1 nitric oxide reductase F protein [Seohaeicola saemankumensis]